MPASIHLSDFGIIAVFAAAFLLIRRYRAQRRSAPIPRRTWVGAGIVFGGQLLALLGVAPVMLFFTPIVWTGYILWVDGAVDSLRGSSLLRSHPAEFAWLAAASIPLWLLFEAYNLRLDNWLYLGLPGNWWLRQLGYVWAFATIWPGIFETAMLLRALDWNAPKPDGAKKPPPPVSAKAATAVSFLGLLMVTTPVLLPPRIGTYLFGSVWLGFIFLLEPINLRTGRASLWRDWRNGDSSRLRALLWAGLLCGLWWEFWNWFAAARWFYIVPILPEWKVFAMPLPGYLGFPAFAVECYALFALIAPWLNGLSRRLGRKSDLEWRLFDL